MPADKAHQNRERNKARDLKQSQWWRQEVGKGICYHCGQQQPREQLTMDHLIPIVRGGKTNKRNCVVSCKACNSEKKHFTRADLALDKQLSEESSDSLP